MRKDIQWKNNRRYYKVEVKIEKLAHYNTGLFFYDLNDEVNNWLDDNEITFWTSRLPMDKNCLTLYFENETDAIAFKMRWE